MTNAFEKSKLHTGDAVITTGRNPGPGTVLYITVPVFRDGNLGQKTLNGILRSDGNAGVALSDGSTLVRSSKCKFCPSPAPDSANGSFRILVADDVLMLRKGLVRTIVNIFCQLRDCPVSIWTSCSAEDV